MKKLIVSILAFLLVVGSASAQQKTDLTLMKINGKNVPLSEFEYIYNKNNSNNAIDKKTLDEYVDLFVNFKLKVEEALAQRLDTAHSFKTELASYQSQLAEPYLQDNSAWEKLIQEAYDRTKNEVEVSHILIKIPNIGMAKDTLEAYNKAMGILKRAAKEDFVKLALEVSEDPSVKRNNGYVGWITAMHTPYAFENAVFSTPVGTISNPVRTFLGYHLIKVTRKRPSRGEVLAAHIMKFTTPEGDNTKAKASIDSIYQRLLAGDKFEELAQNYSDDKGSARNGGELMWFGVEQRMVPEFEETAFALKNKGDVNPPVLSPYGWHIIKLIDKRPIADFETFKPKLEARIREDERNRKTQDAFADKLKKEYNFTLNNASVTDFEALANKYAPTDSLFVVETKKMNKPLFAFAGKTFTQADLAEYIKATPASNTVQAEYIKDKVKNLAYDKLLAYETSQLENKYPEYRYLMKEYHDGILLFEVSNREVWEKASKDTEGLEKFFTANKTVYKWDKPHYKGRVVYCKDKPTMDAAKAIVKNANPDSIDVYLNKRLNDSIRYVKTEKGLWMEGENSVVDAQVFKKGNKAAVEGYPYCFTVGKMLKNAPESYEDVRGAVTTDYQNYLEKEWIATLRKKYPVEIDQNVLKTVKKN